MLSSFRRLTKSRVGTAILILFLLAILASFAIADISNTGAGGLGGPGSLASIEGEELTERDVLRAMDRQLTLERQRNPEAQMADILGDYDKIVAALLGERAVLAFADKTGIAVSRRLVDAEIAKLPGVQGLDGRFSDQAYARFLSSQRMTDAEVRREIASAAVQRLMLAPVAGNARIAPGIARPYAAMLLEQREGEVALVPSALLRDGPAPSTAELAAFHSASRARYLVPEQRVLRYALIDPEQVAGIAASDKEIAADYAANRARYAGRQIRVISQAVVPDSKVAAGIATRARGGASFADAARPAGLSNADISVGPQSRAEFAALAGEAAARAAFAAEAGAIVGPIQSEFGWHVIKIDALRDEPGTPLAAVRSEIAARLTADKRKNALSDLVTAIEDWIDDGASFAEAVQRGKLRALETPPLTAGGKAPGQPAYQLPAEAAPLLKPLFELLPEDDPVIETLPGEAGYALMAVGPVTAAKVPPLAAISEQVREDWIRRRAFERAARIATAIAARAGGRASLAEAVRSAKPALPPVQPMSGRRIDLAQLGGRVPPPLATLFRLPAGKAMPVAAPDEGGYFIVKVGRVAPGNPALDPALVANTQAGFGQAAGAEYSEQFVRAIMIELGVRRDEAAIARVKRQLAASAG